MVSNCSRTIGLIQLPLKTLKYMWRKISIACGPENDSCDTQTLSHEVTTVIDRSIKNTDLIATIIGKLLHAEEVYKSSPPTNYARLAMQQEQENRNTMEQEKNDVVNLLNIRYGILNVIQHALEEQVFEFAAALDGRKVDRTSSRTKMDTEHLLNLLRGTYGKSRGKQQLDESKVADQKCVEP